MISNHFSARQLMLQIFFLAVYYYFLLSLQNKLTQQNV